jgi:hypothetical protein
MIKRTQFKEMSQEIKQICQQIVKTTLTLHSIYYIFYLF